jgi:hypothetical protein
VDRRSDSSRNEILDLAMKLSIKHKGINCVDTQHSRGAFKYLTLYVPVEDCSCPTGSRREEFSSANIDPADAEHGLYEAVGQKILGKKGNRKQPVVAISKAWVNCTAFPSNPNGRAYTGYFDSSSSPQSCMVRGGMDVATFYRGSRGGETKY